MAADWSSQRGPYEPMGYFRGITLDATLVLVVLHVVAMLVAIPFIMSSPPALGAGGQVPGWISLWTFSPDSLSLGNFWSPLTYPFIHDIRTEHIWFAIGLYLFFRFGGEVERFIGRPSFLGMYGLLIALPALICWACQSFAGPFRLAGASTLHFSIFAAFTFIYPGILFFFSIPARYLFGVLFAVYSLACLASMDWIGLIQLWSSVGTAYIFLKYSGVGAEFPPMAWLAAWQARRSEQKHLQRMQRHARTEHRKTQNIDTILEKISRSGMQSLTEDERRDLEKASRRLQERDASLR